jgi:predicted nucleotidyltransferase
MRSKYSQKCENSNLPFRNKPKICTDIRDFWMPGVNNPELDVQTAQTANALLLLMHENFGKSIKGIYLFGSRARGDFCRISDMDIAIRFRPDFSVQLSTLFKLLYISFELLIHHGVYVQIRLLRQDLDYLNPSIVQEGLILFNANRQGMVMPPKHISGEI